MRNHKLYSDIFITLCWYIIDWRVALQNIIGLKRQDTRASLYHANLQHLLKKGKVFIIQWKLEWLNDSTSQLVIRYDILKADWPTSSFKKKPFEGPFEQKCFILFQHESGPILVKLCLVFYLLVTLFQLNSCPSLPYSLSSRHTWKNCDVSLSHKVFSFLLLFFFFKFSLP